VQWPRASGLAKLLLWGGYEAPASKESPMHEVIVAVLFIFMLLGPCLVTLGTAKS
jgi:hypothetical protein